MAKIKDVVAVVGSYTNKAGEQKKEYLNVGSVIETERGQFLVLKAIQASQIDKNGNPCWFFSLYDPKPKEDKKPEPKAPDNDLNDDIPFN